MKTIKQDILEVSNGIIVHSVNCLGPQGGLAGAIARKFPSIAKAYHARLNLFKDHKLPDFWHLGTCLLTPVFEANQDDFYVANIFGQWKISANERQTDYAAIHFALLDLKEQLKELEDNIDKTLPVYFPYGLGSGLGGADFSLISEIIECHFPEAIICQKD